MSHLKSISLMLLFALTLIGQASAQDLSGVAVPKSAASVTITASVTYDGVRITAASSVVQMHVEVYAAGGERVFDNEIRGGNVFDWRLENGQAERLPAGDYVCVVTVKNISGRISQKLGTVSVGEKEVRVGPAEIAKLTYVQQQTIGPIEDKPSWNTLAENENQTPTVIASDGVDGQIVRGRGALSFRLGNFFTGNDREQMRLTEGGNLGIGTAKPKFKLDVAGAVRAREGFVFRDGSTLNVNDRGALTLTNASGNVVPNAAGTGTQNRLAKWTETGGAGTLGDSIVTELNGNLGVNNANPAAQVHIGGFSGYGATTGLLLGPNLLGTQFDRALQVAPVQTAAPSVNTVLTYSVPTINSGVTVPKMYGFFIDGKQGAGAVTSYAALATGQGPSLNATNNTHLLMGQLNIPTGNYAIYEATGFNNFFSGNVGIGDNFPDHKLQVLDFGNTGIRVQTNTGGGTIASFGPNGAFQIDKGAGPNSAGGRFSVLENGKVGIGAGAPTFQLQVIDPSNTGLRVQTNTTGGTVASFGGNGAFQIDAPGVAGGRFTVLENGKVGIGATAPEQTLHANGQILSTGAQAGFKFRDPDVSQDWIWHASITNGQTVARLSLNGSDLIKVRAIDFYTELGGLILDSVNIGGGQQSICRDSNFAIGDCSSSLRYKTNIAPFIPGLSLIRQLRPILFDWKKDGMHDVGFGAEDVAKINPLFVTYNKDGQVEGVKYDRLSTVFVNAFTEQQTQIEQQQEQIKKQAEQLRLQQSQIESLRKLVCADHPNADLCKAP